MKKTVKRIAAMAAMLLCLCSVLPALAAGSMYDELKTALAREAADVVVNGQQELNIYKNMKWTGVYNALPERFDLRDLGVVPPVRSQGSWGTCWGFASIAACETSILSKLGENCAEFKDKHGNEMDLSEKHLAWFATGHLPELSDYPAGQYLYPGVETQAGEGIYQRDAEKLGQASRYNNGGYMAFASSIFAAGMGPVYESVLPYKASDGTSSLASDWTLDDALRMNVSFELENSSILPAPAQSDKNGNYAYNAAGTEAIKSELLSGRAVTIIYHADQAKDPDAMKKEYRDYIEKLGLQFTDEMFDAYFSLVLKEKTLEDLSEKCQAFTLRVNYTWNGVDVSAYTDEELLKRYEAERKEIEATSTQSESESAEAAAKAAAEEAAAKDLARAKAKELGVDYDEYVANLERAITASEVNYINTETYAQYTDTTDAMVNHAVAVIGWDDTYSKSNFLPDHQPPADGAWIVRNSWGKDYGNDGYFYLSYYDQTITAPETFEFVVSDIDKRATQVDIMSYDFMQAKTVSSVQMKNMTRIANVFDMQYDGVLSYVSVLTADLNTTVNVGVYLLNENAKSPVDGVLLDFESPTFLYGGYHRIGLKYNYAVPAGSRVSVVQMQRTETTNGTAYAIPYTLGLSQKYMEAQNILETNEKYQEQSWFEGRIGKGETFVELDKSWTDWADVVTELQTADSTASYLSYDNLGMKLYAYPLSEMKKLHTLTEPIAFYGAHAMICDDCGYTLIEQ